MGILETRDTTNVPTIPEYYKGKCIFITGGSGFMGQALVEKLLYSCPELDSIYLLMRGKRGVPPGERLEKLYSSSCFERLKKEKPSIFKQKVRIVAGDVTEIGLGLSEDDRSLLISRVNIVFHVAASVRFDDPLSYAVRLNLRGTREIIHLAKEMRKLSSFIHVSTCYSNTQHKVVEEKLYPPLGDWRDMLEVCETLDENVIRVLTPKYLNGMPNTYVFTKQLAEHLVNDERGNLPVAIIRPSIVVGSMQEPFPGWVNNFNGPAGLFLACGKGLKTCIYGDPEVICDYVPLDACIKNFIVTAWARGTTKMKETDPIPIFNCSINEKGMYTIQGITRKGFEIGQKYPLENRLWHLREPRVTKSFLLHYINTMVVHLLPAIFIDLVLWLLGKKTILIKLQRKIFIADQALYYFTSRQWEFKNANFLKIRDTLKPEDRTPFYYKIEGYYTDEHMEACMYAGRKYLLREKVDDVLAIEKARVHAHRMMVLDKIVSVLFYGALLWWLINTKYIQSLNRYIINIYSNYI